MVLRWVAPLNAGTGAGFWFTFTGLRTLRRAQLLLTTMWALSVLLILMRGAAAYRLGPLARFLHDLEIGPLPPIAMTQSTAGITAHLNITALTCSGFAIGDLKTSQSTAPPVVTLEASFASVRCVSGSDSFIKVDSILVPNWAGSLEVTVADSKQPSLATSLMVDLDDEGLPRSATFSGTVVKLVGTTQLKSTPKFSARLEAAIHLALSDMASSLEKTLKELLEVDLTQQLSEWLSGSLSPTLRALLNVSTAPLPEAPLQRQALVWSESGAVQLLDVLLNAAIGADGPLGLNGLVRRLTGGTGVVHIPPHFLSRSPSPVFAADAGIPQPSLLEISGLEIPGLEISGLEISLLDARLGGLGHLERIGLLLPESVAGGGAHSMDFVLASAAVDASARLNVTLGPIESQYVRAPPLTETLAVEAGLGELSALTTLFAGVDASLDAVRALFEGRGCLAGAVLDASIRTFQVNATLGNLSAALDSDVPLEIAISQMMADVIGVLTDVLEPLFPRLLAGVASGALRGGLNRRIGAWLSQKPPPCPPPPPPSPLPLPPPAPPGAMDWNESRVLHALSGVVETRGATLLNTLLGAHGDTLALEEEFPLSELSGKVAQHFPYLGAVNITLRNASISGLAGLVDGVALLAPAGGALLRTALNATNAHVDARLGISTTAPWLAADAVGLELGLSVGLSDLLLSTMMMLAVNGSGFGDVELQQLTNGSCIGKQLLGPSPSLVDVQVSSQTAITIMGNDWGASSELQSTALPPRHMALPPLPDHAPARRRRQPLAHRRGGRVARASGGVCAPAQARGRGGAGGLSDGRLGDRCCAARPQPAG